MTDTTQKADTWADGRTRDDQDVLEKLASQADALMAEAQAALERAAAAEAAQKPKRKARAKASKVEADAGGPVVSSSSAPGMAGETETEGASAAADEALTPTLAALEQIRDMREKLQADGSVDTAVTQLNGLYDLMIAFSPVTAAMRQQAFMLDTVNTMIKTTAAIGFWPQRRKAG